MLRSRVLGFASVLCFSYFLVLFIVDPRLGDGALYAEEMYLYEFPVIVTFLFSTMVLWFRGMRVASRTDHSIILAFMFWPYAIYLALGDKD